MSESIVRAINRLVYRAGKRGMKENEVLLSSFVAKHYSGKTCNSQSLDELETFLAEEDNDIHGWLLGRQPFPKTYLDSGLASRLHVHVQSLQPASITIVEPDLPAINE